MHAHVGVDSAGMPGAGCVSGGVRERGRAGGLPSVVAAPALQGEPVGGAGVAAAQAHGCGVLSWPWLFRPQQRSVGRRGRGAVGRAAVRRSRTV